MASTNVERTYEARVSGTPDHEALELVGEHVLAEAARRVLVLPDRLDDPSPRAADEEDEDDGADGDEGPHDERGVELFGLADGAAVVVLAVHDEGGGSAAIQVVNG